MKENKTDNTEHDAKKGTSVPSGGKSKGKKAKNVVPDVFLAKYRPKKRFAAFAGFLAICIGIVCIYDACDVRKKKQDCGYAGISTLECRTLACFTKGGGELEKKKITIKRKKGTKFGIVSGSSKQDKDVFIASIKEGAVADHNAQAEPEDRIYPRDSITTIDGATGSSLRKSLAATTTESVVIELRRSKLPSYLTWIHRSSKPGMLERVLTAPGTKSWFDNFSKLGGVGFFVWYLSGYSAASLPFYYFGLSGAISWHMTRCCHDKEVAAGVPHCYKGGSAKFQVALNRLRTRGEETLAKVKKDPRSYLKWLFWMPDLEKWIK